MFLCWNCYYDRWPDIIAAYSWHIDGWLLQALCGSKNVLSDVLRMWKSEEPIMVLPGNIFGRPGAFL